MRSPDDGVHLETPPAQTFVMRVRVAGGSTVPRTDLHSRRALGAGHRERTVGGKEPCVCSGPH